MELKNILALIIAAALTLSLGACSNETTSSGADEQQAEYTQTSKKLGGYIFDAISDATDKGEVVSDEKTNVKGPVTVTKEELPTPTKKNLLDFSVGKDMYGQKTINIIGDSISQGIGAGDMTNKSYPYYIRKAIKEKYGACNIGFTSLNFKDVQEYSSNYELHTLEFPDKAWSRLYSASAGIYPGCLAYKMGATTETSEMRIKFQRSADKINGSINGFYLYYAKGGRNGKFDLLINGVKYMTVDCSGEENGCARTDYIPLPQSCPDDVTVSIVKAAGFESVIITGISYIYDPEAITVNNYALSGLKLDDVDPALVEKLCKANLVIFALGFNDSGNNIPKSDFVAKLEKGINVCKAEDTPFVLINFIWYDEGVRGEYRKMLAQCALKYEIDYIDMCFVRSDEGGKFLSDYAHPSAYGYSIVGKKINEYLGLS